MAERPVLALLDASVGNRHRDLDVGVSIAPTSDEVTLELPNTAHRKLVPARCKIEVEHVLQRRPVVNPRIRVHGEIEAGISQVVLLFADKRSPRLEIEPRAAIKDLRVNKNLDIPIERFALDGNLLDIIEVRKEVLQVRRRTKVVDEIRLDGIENRDILNLVRMFDVLFKDLMNNTLDICLLYTSDADDD